ncbi:MAG: cation:proton antiporter [Gammaproteobacteria bacterium]|nr:cation:proton antiporter [Gammaproteobacteria bacterium]
MIHTPLLILGLLLVSGLLFGLVASRLKVPRIAAYALAGLLWSQDLLGGYFGFDIASWSPLLTNLALAIIAYTIGGSITFDQLRRLGKTITFCTLGESFGAVIVVSVAIAIYQPDINGPIWILALILGGLAATTDPAMTVAVIHQYRAKGPVTSTLMGVVALDDVLGIILFSVILVVVSGSSVADAIVGSGIEIIGAVGMGIVMGGLLAYLGHRVRNKRFFLPMVLSALMLSQGLAEVAHVSPLLTAMCIGFSARAVYQSGGDRLFAPVEFLEELVFIIFFTLAGAYFKLSVLQQGLDLVFIYVFASVAGKMLGIRLMSRLAGAPKVVSQYLGFCVVPQAGIAIGLALSLMQTIAYKDMGLLVVNTILASTLIYEIIGSFATRFALVRAKEVRL